MMTKENITIAFKTFDTNGDGNIDLAEFRDALPTNTKANLKPVERPGSSGSAVFSTQSTIYGEKQQKQDNEKWEDIIKDVDKNGDGLISFEEFTNAINLFIS